MSKKIRNQNENRIVKGSSKWTFYNLTNPLRKYDFKDEKRETGRQREAGREVSKSQDASLFMSLQIQLGAL